MASPRLGVSLPQFGDAADDAAHVADFAAHAEQAGAASLWVGDRLLAARDPSVGYRGAADLPDRFRRALDPFVLLGAAAVATRTVTLGTSVLVAPLYPPAELARSLTTLQAVSGGRVLAGLGIGWAPEEYAAAGVGFDHRGARLDETLDALDVLFAGGGAGYAGRWVTVPPAHVESPSPPVPVGLGSTSEAGLARVGRRADAWLPAVQLPAPDGPDGTDGAGEVAATLRARREVVDTAAHAAGREPSTIGTVLRVNVTAGTDLADAASALATVLDATGITDAFVDPVTLAPRAGDALDAFVALRDRLAGA